MSFNFCLHVPISVKLQKFPFSKQENIQVLVDELETGIRDWITWLSESEKAIQGLTLFNVKKYINVSENSEGLNLSNRGESLEINVGLSAPLIPA